MKKIILGLLFFGSFSIAAVTYDSHVQGLYRSFPGAVAVSVDGGAAWKLWDKEGVLYGYIRPNINFQTSGVTNQLRAQLDIFPVSFFGFVIGMAWNKRDYEEFSSFTCSEVNCSGQIRRSYVGHNMALAYKNFFLVSKWKVERVEMTDRSGTFVDVRASLLARSRYDQHLEGQVIAGYKIGDQHSLGVLSIYNSMKYFDNNSSMWMGFHRYEWDKWSLLSGVGFMDTRLNKRVGSMMLILRWTPEKGIQLI